MDDGVLGGASLFLMVHLRFSVLDSQRGPDIGLRAPAKIYQVTSVRINKTEMRSETRL